MASLPGGEHAIIQGYFARLAQGHPGSYGLRDDAATITPPPGHDLVVTVDAVASGVHFFANDQAADIGWKALAVNVSDLVAKGAIPHAYVMSLAFPEPPTLDWLESFAHGLEEAQRAFAITLIGGDTDRRPGPLSVTITAFGFVPTGQMVRRTTAQVGDRIFVSGTLGDAALGLLLHPAWPTPPAWHVPPADQSALVARYLRPQPRAALAPVVRAHATASMDISDGLQKDLGRMASASHIGAVIDACALPLSLAAAAIVRQDPTSLSLIATGGDDYEILATVPPAQAQAFIQAALAVGVSVHDIGVCREGSGVTLTGPDGHPLVLANSGYDHFQ